MLPKLDFMPTWPSAPCPACGVPAKSWCAGLSDERAWRPRSRDDAGTWHHHDPRPRRAFYDCTSCGHSWESRIYPGCECGWSPEIRAGSASAN